MSDSFSIYRSTFEALKASSAADVKAAIIMFGEYAMDDIVPEPRETPAYAMFCLTRPLIDRSKKKAEAGKTGGSKPEANGSKPEANGSKVEANGSKVEANGSKPEAKEKGESRKEKGESRNIKDKGSVGRFTPPTPQQVAEYVQAHGYSVDVQRFVDFYESKGWYVGKNKMKDWKAAVRNWDRSQRQELTTKGRQESTAKAQNFTPREYDYDDLERQLLAKQGEK